MGKAVGLFGGTFDPVHIGHLRTALELQELLQLDEMRLLPCGDPYHRGNIDVTPGEHRVAMLRLAVKDQPFLRVDDRELLRNGATYSYDTLVSVREELADDDRLLLCVGMDSLCNLSSWHRWQDLLSLANLVVACRPGFTPPTSGPVAELVAQYAVDSMECMQSPSGAILIREMTLLSVSATELRNKCRRGLSIKWLVPDVVNDYIVEHQLYR